MAKVAKRIQKSREGIDPTKLIALSDAISLVKERAKTVVELADQLAFVFQARPIVLLDKAQGLLTDDTRARLRDGRRVPDEPGGVTGVPYGRHEGELEARRAALHSTAISSPWIGRFRTPVVSQVS